LVKESNGGEVSFQDGQASYFNPSESGLTISCSNMHQETISAPQEPQTNNDEGTAETMSNIGVASLPPLSAPLPPQPAFASVGVQALPTYSFHEVNTQSNPLRTTGMNHTEGGWPAEVDPTDGEQVARWRKKVERDEDYIRTVLRLSEVVEQLIRQNNALDIYTDYFADVTPLILEPPGVSTLSALRHPMAVQRAVQALSWSLDGSGRIAAAFSPGDSQNASTAGGLCSIFDVASPTTPLATLTSASHILCLAHNFRDHSLLGTGQLNGQFALFDVRQGPEAVGLTNPRPSHTDCLTSIAWTQSKAGTEFMTAGLDGHVIWWDSRRLNECIETLVLKERTGGAGTQQAAAATEGPCFAATCLEYSIAAGPAKFMVGTSSGSILSGNRRSKTPVDRITGSFTGHVGPIVSISRHPFFPKHFLSIADWTARVWSEDLHSELVATPCRPSYYSAGAWSQNRPSVLYCTAADGSLEAWDLLKSHSEPVVTANVADCALTCLAVQDTHANRGLLAVGCKDGTTLLVKPSAGLTQSQGDEKATFAAMMEREVGREKGLEKASKEAKARARKEAARAAEPVTRVSPAELEELERDILSKLAVRG
jgi:dynein intermediate chain 2